MAWFSGRVSLGNFPDIAGAVNKLQESVKNIEKNFDTALGFEEKEKEKADSSNEGTSYCYYIIHTQAINFYTLFCFFYLKKQFFAMLFMFFNILLDRSVQS